ncbi:MAG: hypothetical protein JXR41_13970 [Bacteroidales bacterium]|nr:hypothetical protein [Bacteroidales bacterium]MBN2764195.1 hypothetical protein [Bacteroidales bacterium]
MKKIFAGLVILLLGGKVFSQSYVPSREDINAFYTTKTLVVLEDNPLLEYNYIIKEIMKQEWTITEYDFISSAEFEEKRKDPQYSFIYQAQVTFENDNTDAAYRFLHLSLGGDYFRMNEMPDIVAVPLSYYSVEEDNYAYKLAVLLRFMQNHALLIRDNPEILSANVFKHYNDNIKDIQDKTLYILENELSKDVNSAARIKKVYPYKFRIATKEEIEEAIEERNPDVVFLHKVGPEGTKLDARCYKVIIGAADANFYYFDYHKISDKNPDGFLEKDFKSLVKK